MTFIIGLFAIALICIGIIGYNRLMPVKKPKLKEIEPMEDNCRVTLNLQVEFNSEMPEDDMARLRQLAETDPETFVRVVYRSGYYKQLDINTEELL